MMHSREEPFTAPDAAVDIRPRAARLFLLGVNLLAIVAVFVLGDLGALWPTPSPGLSVVVLAALVAVTNAFGTFQKVGGLAEYASLAMPVNFAMLLVLDWRHFVLGIALGEIFTFVAEKARNVHPTVWYVRVFNVAVLVVAGAGASGLLTLLRPLLAHAAGGWASPVTAFALLAAAVVWKILDNVSSNTLLHLAAESRIADVRIPFRGFFAQFALFLIAIPFAWSWQANVWLSLFALASLGVAYQLLGVPELEHRAKTDARTGLSNATAFERRLDEAIEAGALEGHTLALLAIDIDHFKRVNDRFGHLAGDAVIARFGRILAEAARREDVAARTGGEEFAILFHGGDRRGAVAFAERLRLRVAQEAFQAEGLDVPLAITISIGIAVFPHDAQTASNLRRAADVALYEAKQGGRNTIRAASDVA